MPIFSKIPSSRRTFILILLLFPLLGFSQIPTNGLVAWYPFTNGSNDQSNSGFTGTPVGAVQTTDRHSVPNGAYYFDGQDDVLSFGDILDTTFTGVGKQFSISFWLNQDVGTGPLGDSRILMAKYAYSGCSEAERTMYISMDGPDIGIFYTSDNSLANYRIVATTQAPLSNQGAWHHVVMNYDGTQNGNNGADRIEFYVDNVVRVDQVVNQGGSVPTELNDSQAALGLGGFLSSAGQGCGPFDYFTGSLDDVRIYNRLLSQAEVTELFNEVFVSVEDPLASLVEIFPQPAPGGKFQVQVPGEMVGAQLAIQDLTGRVVYTQGIHSEQTILDLQELTRGVYLLELKREEGLVRRKIYLQ